jgi:phosphonatase-like hydrolase
MAIELVVFDMAGTTVRDPGAVNTGFRAALAAAGLAVTPPVVDGVMGLPKREAIRRLVEASPAAAVLRDRIDTIHDDFVVRMRDFYATAPGVAEMPGATATFAALRRGGIQVALNTGFSRDVAGVLLDRLGWSGAGAPVDATVTSDEVPRGRPYPDMIRQLMARLGIRDAARVAKVGDTPADLEEGASAGCGLVIGMTGGTHDRAALQACPHTHLIDSLAELPGLVASVSPLSFPAQGGSG